MNGGDILELSVAEFSRRLARLIERQPALQEIAIRGEVSKWNPQANGNLYFTLKDATAALSCFAFASDVARFPVVSDGVAVRAVGGVSIREQRSEYQLRVMRLELVGVGALAAQIEALRERLRIEGVFEDDRRRDIPPFIRRIALVSAPGEAREDFERRIRARAPHVRVTFFPARVQGIGADVDIARAMDEASKADVDVVVLTRGGGSYEDRFAFNLEPVLRAILRSRHPVITAIGHARDRHLADDVADRSADTPTAAAEGIIAPWERVLDRLRRLKLELTRAFRDNVILRKVQRLDSAGKDVNAESDRRVFAYRNRLNDLSRALENRSPSAQLGERRARLVQITSRLAAWPAPAVRSVRRELDLRIERLDVARERSTGAATRTLVRLVAELNAEDPLRPLERGYAILTKAGRNVRDVRQVSPGDAIAAQLAHGTLDARVERVQHDG
jgi:exodeoxyribonuclease VII large subunit